MNQAVAPPPNEPADFSLVLGGPLFQLLRRAHLAGDALQMLRRRVVVLTTLAWAPLLVLSVVKGARGPASRCRSSTTWSFTPGCCWRCRC